MGSPDPRTLPGGIAVVLLDLDGTLMDHRGAVADALQGWLGDRATPAAIDRWFVVQERHLAEWRAGRIDWTEQRRRRLIDFLPTIGEPVGTPEQLDRVFTEGYLTGYGRSWRAFPEAARALGSLRHAGYALAVLTNGSEAQQRAKLAAIDLLDVVGPVFTAEGIDARKPDPRAFEIVCERLGCSPAEVVYVGDEYEVDVVAARAAGLHAVLIDRDDTGPAGEPARLHDLEGLLALLESSVLLR